MKFTSNKDSEIEFGNGKQVKKIPKGQRGKRSASYLYKNVTPTESGDAEWRQPSMQDVRSDALLG